MHKPDVTEVLDRFPDAPIDRDNLAHYAGLLRRQLLISRCAECGRWFAPPRGLCPACWSDEVAPQPVVGTGVVHLLIELHRGPAAQGVGYSTPYPVAVIELDEQSGLRTTGTLIDPARTLTIGSRVRLTWIERAGVPVPAFAPAD